MIINVIEEVKKFLRINTKGRQIYRFLTPLRFVRNDTASFIGMGESGRLCRPLSPITLSCYQQLSFRPKGGIFVQVKKYLISLIILNMCINSIKTTMLFLSTVFYT